MTHRDARASAGISRPPLRVVHVSCHADPEHRDPSVLLDSWRVLGATGEALGRVGVEMIVVHAAHHQTVIERDGIPFHFVDDTGAMPRRIIGGLRTRRKPGAIIRRVRELAPDIVHSHDLHLPIAVGQIARAMRGTPLVVQDHAVVPPADWRRFIWRRALAPVAGAVFTARAQATEFFEAGVFRDDLPIFESLPTSTAFAPGDQVEARRVAEIKGNPCVVWTTHLDANKDPLTALDAFETAAAMLPDARLWCAFARAPLLDVVRDRIARSPVLSERVTLLGALPHERIEALFQGADIFLQTSRREASGRSLLEAMACGTVPVVTDIPAWRRMIGDAGHLAPVGDSAALARAIVAAARADREHSRAAVRRRFDEALTWDSIARELRSAYDRLLGNDQAES